MFANKEVIENRLKRPCLDSLPYALNFDLVTAVREKRWSDCAVIFDTLQSEEVEASEFHCVDWGEDSFSVAKRKALQRCINSDPAHQVALTAIGIEEFARLETLTGKALHLLRQVAPDCAGELTELVRELVFANCDQDVGFAFDGITSFHCWGVLFLNAAEHQDLIELVDGLSHEGAHAYLFGLSAGTPYLINGLDQRFSSPLRTDPRPLEGIFHATFVSARMHYAQSRLLSSGRLSLEDAEKADAARDMGRQAFYAGLQTLEAYAEFTPLGKRLLADTLAYMRSEDA